MTCWIDEHDQIDTDAASRDSIPQEERRAEYSIDHRTVMRSAASLAEGIDIRQHNARYQASIRNRHVCTGSPLDVESASRVQCRAEMRSSQWLTEGG